MATTYDDFDPWGMEGNDWGGSWGTDNWDDLNIWANTGLDTMWNPDTTMWDSVSFPSGNLQQEFMSAPQYGVNNEAYNAQPFYSQQASSYKPSPMLGEIGKQIATGAPVNMPGWQQASTQEYKDLSQPEDSNILGQITGGINKAGKWLQSNKDLTRLLGGAYSAYRQGRTANALQDMQREMISKFGNPNAAMYAAGHKNYYQNPGEWKNSPYVQVPYQQASREYLAKMAAQGRSNPNEMAYTQAQMLNYMASKSYNNWMQSSYPWGQENQNLIGPYSNMMTGANANELNKYNGILEWLARMSGIPQSELGITGDKSGEDMKKMFELLLKLRG